MSRNISSNTINTRDGLLTALVAQTSDIAPEMRDNNVLYWREPFEGAYDTIKDIPATLSRGVARSVVARAHFTGANILYDPPDYYSKHEWRLDSAIVEQKEAGEHATITFTWYSDPNGKEDDDPSTDPIVSWTLSYGQSNVNVLAYCTNSDPLSSDTQGYTTGESYASRIQAWWNQPQDTAYYQPAYKFVSALGAGKIQELGLAEKAIAKKLQQGRNPMRHYPIITKTSVYPNQKLDSFDIPRLDELAGSGDLSDSPFSGSTVYKDWLKVGLTYNYNGQTNSTTITETWWGAEEWDEDFYSSTAAVRWEFGKVNDAKIRGNL